MKNYRYFGDEMEILGNRLDHARECATNAKSAWATNYWRQNVEQLLFQWQQLPILHDGDAQTTIIPKWTVDYEFYERGYMNEGYGFTDRAYQKVFKHDANLESSWHNHREARLARAQF
jgi:hypothetical protein